VGRLASAPRARVLLVLAVTVLALALRVHLLGEADIWWDEGYSAWLARLGATAIPVETAYDVHPPFYYLLLHWWFQVAGDGEFSLRFPSALGWARARHWPPPSSP
jgi:mannosyltransferase